MTANSCWPSAPISAASARRAASVWQAVVLHPPAVLLIPSGRCHGPQPLGRHHGQLVQRCSQCLAHPLQPVQPAHGGEHMRAVRALAPTRLDQTPLLQTPSKASSRRRSARRRPSASGTRSARCGRSPDRPTAGRAHISSRSGLVRRSPPRGRTGFPRTAARSRTRAARVLPQAGRDGETGWQTGRPGRQLPACRQSAGKRALGEGGARDATGFLGHLERDLRTQ